MKDLEELRTILIQTGFNIDRMFSGERIDKKKALSVLKYRNELALEQLNNLLKPDVSGRSEQLVCLTCRKEVEEDKDGVWCEWCETYTYKN